MNGRRQLQVGTEETGVSIAILREGDVLEKYTVILKESNTAFQVVVLITFQTEKH